MGEMRRVADRYSPTFSGKRLRDHRAQFTVVGRRATVSDSSSLNLHKRETRGPAFPSHDRAFCQKSSSNLRKDISDSFPAMSTRGRQARAYSWRKKSEDAKEARRKDEGIVAIPHERRARREVRPSGGSLQTLRSKERDEHLREKNDGDTRKGASGSDVEVQISR